MTVHSVHPARIAASLLLLAGGFLIAVSALAIWIAQLLVDGGMVVKPADAALLSDLVAVLPFFVGFAVVNVLAAIGLLISASWAESLAVAAGATAVAGGALGLLLVVAGRDPFAPTAAHAASADGLGILAVFTGLYVLVLVALAAGRPRATSLMGAAA
jgi:hypothetical protein